jgi:hypothetical protein
MQDAARMSGKRDADCTQEREGRFELAAKKTQKTQRGSALEVLVLIQSVSLQEEDALLFCAFCVFLRLIKQA